MVARPVSPEEPLGPVRLDPDDADRALDDDHQLVAEVALADDRLARRIDALDGGQRDPLEVLRVEALEHRHAPEQEHRLEVAEGPARLGHVRPSCDRLPHQAGDPWVVIIEQPVRRPHRDPARPIDIVLEQADERAGQPPVAGRVERLDGLRPGLRVVRAKAAADDAAGLRRPEHDQGAERLVLDAALAAVEHVAQETERASRPGAGAGSVAARTRARPAQGRPPGRAARGSSR